MRKGVAIVVATSLLTGCGSPAKKPEPTDNASVVQTLKSYYDASQAGLISAYIRPSGLEQLGGYSSFSNWWCLDLKSSIEELESLVQAHCKSLGGEYKNRWCYAPNDDNYPFYKVRIGRAGDIFDDPNPNRAWCTAGFHDIGVTAIEGLGRDSSTWRNFAIKRGFNP